MIYLDNNATTPVAPEVVEAMLPFLREDFGNPSSLHPLGTHAADALARARGALARLVGARTPREVLFTSGGTESIHLALHGVLGAGRAAGRDRRRLVTSTVEHPAVLAPLERLAAREGYELVKVPVDGEGRLDVDRTLEAIDERTAFASLQWVNNETGVVTPDEALAAVAGACRGAGAPLHVDGMQAAGKIPLAAAELGLDLVSLSAHKFHGPKGVGALWVRSGLELEPLFVGGPQEGDRRAGTENVPAVVGAGRAAELARAHAADPAARERLGALRDRLEAALLARPGGAVVSGAGAHRVPSTANLTFEGVAGDALVLMLGERGVAASSGSACSSGKQGPSPVLVAMGYPEERALGALRLSLSRTTTSEEVDRAAEAVAETVELLREIAPAGRG